jgi:hypothetical protein
MSDDGRANHNDNDDDETTKTGNFQSPAQERVSLVYKLLARSTLALLYSRETEGRAWMWRNKIKWRDELGPISIGVGLY